MKNWLWVFAIAVVIGMAATAAHAAKDGIITKEELNKVLDDPDLVILDVRTGRDWRSSEFKIKGAVRANPPDFDKWIAQHDKSKRYVTYCA